MTLRTFLIIIIIIIIGWLWVVSALSVFASYMATSEKSNVADTKVQLTQGAINTYGGQGGVLMLCGGSNRHSDASKDCLDDKLQTYSGPAEFKDCGRGGWCHASLKQYCKKLSEKEYHKNSLCVKFFKRGYPTGGTGGGEVFSSIVKVGEPIKDNFVLTEGTIELTKNPVFVTDDATVAVIKKAQRMQHNKSYVEGFCDSMKAANIRASGWLDASEITFMDDGDSVVFHCSKGMVK